MHGHKQTYRAMHRDRKKEIIERQRDIHNRLYADARKERTHINGKSIDTKRNTHTHKHIHTYAYIYII